MDIMKKNFKLKNIKKKKRDRDMKREEQPLSQTLKNVN